MGKKVEAGTRVAVVGGGNTAIDAARVARRLGATSVTVVYRRSRPEMPANPAEVEAAEAEGIDIMFLATPTRIIAQNGKVTQVECTKMELGEPDDSGRRRPVPVKGSEFIIDVDTVIPGLGQAPNLEFAQGFETTNRGTISVDEYSLATSIEAVFAGGDVVSGPDMVITAIAAGKKAARSIDRYLKGETLADGEDKLTSEKLTEAEITAIKERFSRIESQVVGYEIVPDEVAIIINKLTQWADDGGTDIIVTTGGTGLGPRDVTPEATRRVLDKEVPGLTEAMRAETFHQAPTAILSTVDTSTEGRYL